MFPIVKLFDFVEYWLETVAFIHFFGRFIQGLPRIAAAFINEPA